MSLPVVFRPAASADAEEAFHWYEARRPGLGLELLAEIDRVVKTIAESPDRFPLIHREARRALLSRFPYAIFYRVIEERIVVVACFHAKRNPSVWKSRV